MRIPTIPGFDQDAFTRYLKNTGWLFMARVGSMLIKMVVGIAVANYLGKDNYSLLSYSQSFVLILVAIAGLGLDSFLTREIAREPEKHPVLLGTAFRMRIIAGLAIMPLIWLAYEIFSKDALVQVPLSYILIVGCCGIAQSLNIIDCYFQATVQSKFVMYVQVAGNIASAIIKLLLILLDESLIWFVCALLFDAVLLAIGYLLAYRAKKYSVFSWSFDKKRAAYLLKHSWPLAFSAILISIYMRVDQLMIGSMLGNELGVYATVVTLTESWYFIPIAIVSSVFPALMHARRDDPNRYQKRLQNLYDLMAVLSIGIAMVMTFASDLVYHLFYNAEYRGGAKVLTVYVWSGIFVFLGSAIGQYLLAEGFTYVATLRTGFGAILKIALNFIWIPEFGIIGAAYATLVAYAGSTFFVLLIPSTRRQGLMMLRSLVFVSYIRALSRMAKR